MTNAEKRALQHTGYCRNQSYEDFLKGYRQAEKDLVMTWMDMNDIKLIIEQVEADYEEQDRKSYTMDFYKEVLKRFKERKDNR